MKKLMIAVMAMFALLSAVSAAVAGESKPESLELKFVTGKYNSVTTIGPYISENKVSVKGMDLNWNLHKRFWGLSWGPVLRYRKLDALFGNMKYVGAGVSIGYVSNVFEDKKRRPVGWHTHLSAGMGKLSGVPVPRGYTQEALDPFSNWDFGLDWKIKSWDSKTDAAKYKSALVLSYDIGREIVRTFLKMEKAPYYFGSLDAEGTVHKFGLSYYW